MLVRSKSKPVLYLDIDDTLLVHRGICPKAAPGAKDFLLWSVKHFDVRWLSMWFCKGYKLEHHVYELAEYFDLPPEFINDIPSPAFTMEGSFRDECNKASVIDFNENFVWVEDGLTRLERETLRKHKAGLRHIPCNVTADPSRLGEVKFILMERFNIPNELAS